MYSQIVLNLICKWKRNDNVFSSLYQKLCEMLHFFNDKSLVDNYGDMGRILKFSQQIRR